MRFYYTRQSNLEIPLICLLVMDDWVVSHSAEEFESKIEEFIPGGELSWWSSRYSDGFIYRTTWNFPEFLRFSCE